jgi:dTMP kinase
MRNIVLSPEFTGLDARSEALLFAASRGEHAARVIRPALDRGAVVVCDRYLDSSVAYQGYGRNLGAEKVRSLSLWATNSLLPDLTIVLDIDPVVGLMRITNPDRLEAEPLVYHELVRAAFLEIADGEPDRYLVIDASRAVSDIAAEVCARVDLLMQGRQ